MTDEAHPDARVSDDEREAVVERLRVARTDGRLTGDELDERAEAAYRARTRRDLAMAVRDLPDGTVPVVPAPAPGVAAVPAAAEPVGSFVAVFAGCQRRGRWRVPRSGRAVAVFGGVDLDLRDAEFSGPATDLRAVAVFGGIQLTVPEGAEVEMTGAAVFGGKSCHVPPARPGAPRVRVRVTAVFGGVEVRARPPRGGAPGPSAVEGGPG